jgi:putative membrane protein
MKGLTILATIVGVAVMVALVGYFGAGAVMHSLLAVGWLGFGAICAIHLALMALMGFAWWVLMPGTPAWTAVWGRLVRDAGSELLPFWQVGGYVLGARALALTGVSGTVAAASTIVDVTFEFISQLAYTALGLVLLVQLQPDSAASIPVLIGLAVAVTAAAGFLFVQRHGLGYVDRIVRVLGRGWAERSAAGAAALQAALHVIYRRPGGLWLCFLLHLGCWIASTFEAWFALHIAGEPLSFTAVLVLESMLYAVRTAAFAVPNAVGVQEGAYVLLGATFGLSPEMALALSLLKRARDIAIGLPTLGIWQAHEGGRLWRRRGATAADRVTASSRD